MNKTFTTYVNRLINDQKKKEYPPKNTLVKKIDNKNILLYSPEKNKANTKEEYSTLNPATSYAYAYGKSNGVRLV